MSTETSNYGFTKDNEDEFYNVNTVNTNLDKIDTEMKRIEDESKSFNEQVVDNTNAITNVNTKLDAHIKDDIGHVRYVGGIAGQNGLGVAIADVPVIDPNVTNPVPKTGYTFRFLKTGATNTGNVTIQISYGGGKVSLNYPVYDGQGKNLTAGAMTINSMYTIAFSGTAFFLQGSGSGVNIGTRGIQIFNTPGSMLFTVPDGVTRLVAQLWGGGGGGGGANSFHSKGGGGGGAGAFKEYLLRVTPGSRLTINVGFGGNGGTFSNNSGTLGNNGTAGGPSEVIGAASGNVVAWGGGAGTGALSASGYGGEGGTHSWQGTPGSIVPPATVPVNGRVFQLSEFGENLSPLLKTIAGGSGSYGSSFQGGGGGGAPSDTYFGTGGFNASPGGGGSVYSYQTGGRGGTGAGTTPSELQGGYPGGGGAGGNSYTSAVYNGGNGAHGLVILAW